MRVYKILFRFGSLGETEKMCVNYRYVSICTVVVCSFFGERPSHDDVVIAIIIIITIITFYHILLLPILRLKITRHIRYVVSRLPRVNCLK